MKILITGGSGFIGRSVIQKLIDGRHTVMVLSRSGAKLAKEKNNEGIQWINSSLELEKEALALIKNFEPEAVIHLAWENIPDFSFETSFKNLKDQVSFFREILKIPSIKKIIAAGSGWEYNKKLGSCLESDPCVPNNYFTWSKNSLREFLKVECSNKNIVLAWIRIFFVYGPGQRSGSLIPTIINDLSAKIIPDVKTHQNANDFIYVEDIALAFDQLIKRKITSGIYNLGSGNSTSVLEVFRIAEKVIHGDEKMTNLLLERSMHIKKETDFWADMEKTTRDLEWKPLISLEEGIKKMVKQLVRN